MASIYHNDETRISVNGRPGIRITAGTCKLPEAFGENHNIVYLKTQDNVYRITTAENVREKELSIVDAKTKHAFKLSKKMCYVWLRVGFPFVFHTAEKHNGVPYQGKTQKIEEIIVVCGARGTFTGTERFPKSSIEGDFERMCSESSMPVFSITYGSSGKQQAEEQGAGDCNACGEEAPTAAREESETAAMTDNAPKPKGQMQNLTMKEQIMMKLRRKSVALV
jgi:hypothetical protein